MLLLLNDDSGQPMGVGDTASPSSVIYAPSRFCYRLDDSICSALVLLFPAFGTRHTFYADRAAAAFLKIFTIFSGN